MLGVALDEQHETDYKETQEGIPFIVDKDLIEMYKGFDIDFTTNWFSRALWFSQAQDEFLVANVIIRRFLL